MKLFALLGVLALAACASPAAASPTFRSDGPNAEAYGAAEGYPVGRATAGGVPQRFMGGTVTPHRKPPRDPGGAPRGAGRGRHPGGTGLARHPLSPAPRRPPAP